MLQTAVRKSVLRAVLAPAACLVLATSAVSAQDAEDLLAQGIDAYRTGDTSRAVELFKDALATNPGQDEIYRVWEHAEQDTIRDMLLERGELGTLTERFLGLARRGRTAVVTDPGGARDVVAEYLDGDPVASREALLRLQASYGEWAVPALVGPLGDRADSDHRVQAMRALIHLGDLAVPPLVQVLHAEDVTTRTNTAAVLGSIGDVRAAPALAWMAQGDESEVARLVASEAVAKMAGTIAEFGASASDPLSITLALSHAWVSGDPRLSKPYASGQVAWSWDGGLNGEPVLGGLYGLLQAESALRTAMAGGAPPSARAALAAVHATMKAEIEEAATVDGLADSEFLATAQERLPGLDLALAGAGSARGEALSMLVGADAPGPAMALMAFMGGSPDELSSLRSAVTGSHHGLAVHAALALARLGDADSSVVSALGGALASVPDRLAFSIGDTGLAGAGDGWQMLSSDQVAEGLLRAKAFPPKDVVLVRYGTGGVTLDTMVFGLRNDPRTAEVPVIVVTPAEELQSVTSRYGDTVALVVAERATWADVAGVAGDADALMVAARGRAIMAAEALSAMPAERLFGLDDQVSQAIGGGDDDVTIAALHLVDRGVVTGALPAVEDAVLDDGAAHEVRIAAFRAAARLWAARGASNGDARTLAQTIAPFVGDDDHELAMAAASALGQLGFVPGPADDGDLSAAQVEALRALGYVGG